MLLKRLPSRWLYPPITRLMLAPGLFKKERKELTSPPRQAEKV
jgi:hypothetical protein